MSGKYLFLLPFDHRNGFLEKESEAAKKLKWLIYQGFELAIKENYLPKDQAAILVDEQFGSGILQDAKTKGYLTCLCVEKSGQNEFEFEYGQDFGGHVNKFRPDFAKALVRYNPEGDEKSNKRQREKLKRLSDFCQKENYQFLLEPLVPATESQLAKVKGDKIRYDNEIRPELMIKMIRDIQESEIKPDVWKIEGLENAKDYQSLMNQIKSADKNAEAIILGRAAENSQVEKWLKAGAKVPGIIGFAIGRTIFWQPLINYQENKIGQEAAILLIAQNYRHFYQIFINAK